MEILIALKDLEKMTLIDNNLFICLCILMVIDILTGIAKAIKKKKLKSSFFRNGGFKKFLILVLIFFAYVIDTFLFEKETFLNICLIYYIVNEGISIIENSAICGVKFPKKLKEILEQLNKMEG